MMSKLKIRYEGNLWGRGAAAGRWVSIAVGGCTLPWEGVQIPWIKALNTLTVWLLKIPLVQDRKRDMDQKVHQNTETYIV